MGGVVLQGCCWCYVDRVVCGNVPTGCLFRVSPSLLVCICLCLATLVGTAWGRLVLGLALLSMEGWAGPAFSSHSRCCLGFGLVPAFCVWGCWGAYCCLYCFCCCWSWRRCLGRGIFFCLSGSSGTSTHAGLMYVPRVVVPGYFCLVAPLYGPPGGCSVLGCFCVFLGS